jgi:hypothetical protein
MDPVQTSQRSDGGLPAVPNMTPQIGTDQPTQNGASTAQTVSPFGADAGQSIALPRSQMAAGSIKTNTNNVDSSTTNQSVNTIAKVTSYDSELIEKQWVDKAKNIISQTINDPYQQNRQLMALKADYIKQRYNKDIKQSE